MRGGIELYLLNRGGSIRQPAAGAIVLQGDIQRKSVQAALGSLNFEAVVNWVAYTPEHVQNDVELFHGRTGNIFSSALPRLIRRLPIFFR